MSSPAQDQLQAAVDRYRPSPNLLVGATREALLLELGSASSTRERRQAAWDEYEMASRDQVASMSRGQRDQARVGFYLDFALIYYTVMLYPPGGAVTLAQAARFARRRHLLELADEIQELRLGLPSKAKSPQRAAR